MTQNDNGINKTAAVTSGPYSLKYY
jgi:hypothetical protein